MKDIVVFPKPSGQFDIGYFDDYISYKKSNEERCLGYRCFYPAKGKTKIRMNYIDKEMYKMFEELAHKSPINELYKKYMRVKTNCYKNASIIDGKYRVIIYSPGYNSVPWANLIQIEELVSNGYVVFAVARAGENFCTIVEDKREKRKIELFAPFIEEVVKNMMLSDEFSTDPRFIFNWSIDGIREYLNRCEIATERMDVWADDIIKVMDFVQEKVKDEKYMLFNKLDCEEFGTFGYSFGGSASVYASDKDYRIAASINLDGWIYGNKLACKKLEKPALVFSKSLNHYLASFGESNNNVYNVVIEDTINEFFSDHNIMAEDFFSNSNTQTESIDGKMISLILNEFVKGFFDINLLKIDKCLSNVGKKYENTLKLFEFK